MKSLAETRRTWRPFSNKRGAIRAFMISVVTLIIISICASDHGAISFELLRLVSMRSHGTMQSGHTFFTSGL
jgi:hypothetical protein